MSTTPTFPVKFTQAQRKVIAQILPPLAMRLKLREPNVRTIRLTPSELARIEDQARAAREMVGSRSQARSMHLVACSASDALQRVRGVAEIPFSRRVLQLRIELAEVEPLIWRGVWVKDCSLERLHGHLQLAMGWMCIHPYKFTIGEADERGATLGDQVDEDPIRCKVVDDDGHNTTPNGIGGLLPPDGKPFAFTYRYGRRMEWGHKVTLQGCTSSGLVDRYPVCFAGARACPPEAVGGPRGYRDFVAALTDTFHKRHGQALMWHPTYDPEEFDAAVVTMQMQQGSPNWSEAERVRNCCEWYKLVHRTRRGRADPRPSHERSPECSADRDRQNTASVADPGRLEPD